MTLNHSSSSVFRSGLSFKQKSGAAHRLRCNEVSDDEESYFPLLFVVYLLFALRGTHNQKAVPNLPQYQALGGGRSWVLGRGQRYNKSLFTSSRAGRSSSAGWQWAAATASEGWCKQWHQRPGAQQRRPSGRGCPPSSGTLDRRLLSLQTHTETGEWQLSHDRSAQQ